MFPSGPTIPVTGGPCCPDDTATIDTGLKPAGTDATDTVPVLPTACDFLISMSCSFCLEYHLYIDMSIPPISTRAPSTFPTELLFQNLYTCSTPYIRFLGLATPTTTKLIFESALFVLFAFTVIEYVV